MARKGLLLLGIASPLPLLAEESREAWAMFLPLVVAPVLALGLGAAGEPAADRFWGGLGGTPRGRLVARLVIHLGLVAALVVTGWIVVAEIDPVRGWDPLDILLLGILLSGDALLYLSTALSRRFAGGLSLLSGPLFAGALLATAGWLGWWIGAFSVLEGLLWRLLVLSLGALVALARSEGRLLGRGFPWRVGLGGVALAGASLLPELAWNGRPLLVSPHVTDVRMDAGEALFVPPPSGIDAPRRALLWKQGDWSLVGPPGVVDARFGPAGTRFYVVEDDGPLDGGSAWRGGAAVSVVLEAGDDRRVRCALPHGVWPYGADIAFLADASAVAVGFFQGPDEGVAILSTDGTCTFAWTSSAETFASAVGTARRPVGPPYGASGPFVWGRSSVEGRDVGGVVLTKPEVSQIASRLHGPSFVRREGEELVDLRTGTRWAAPPLPYPPGIGDFGEHGQDIRVYGPEGETTLGPSAERATDRTTLLGGG